MKRTLASMLILLMVLPMFGQAVAVQADDIDPETTSAITRTAVQRLGRRIRLDDEPDGAFSLAISSFQDDGQVATLVVSLSYQDRRIEEQLAVSSGKGLGQRFADQLGLMLDHDLLTLLPPPGKRVLGSGYRGQYAMEREDGLRTGDLFFAHGGDGAVGLLSVNTILSDVALLSVYSNHGIATGQSLEKAKGIQVEGLLMYGGSSYWGGEIAGYLNHPSPFRLVGAVSWLSSRPFLSLGIEGVLPLSLVGKGWFLQNSSLSVSARASVGLLPATIGADATVTFRYMLTPRIHLAIAGRRMYQATLAEGAKMESGYLLLVGGGYTW